MLNNIVLGLHCSVKLDDIMTHFMYRAELCFQRCAEASVRVYRCVCTKTKYIAKTLTLVLLSKSLYYTCRWVEI